eukprot:s129_g5.t2
MMIWNVAWLALLLGAAGRKLGLQTTQGFGGETGRPAHLTFKLKAVHFVDPKTQYVELGHLQILTSNGTCLTCTDDKVCSSPSHPLEDSDPKYACSEAKAGKKFSWRVKSTAVDESDIIVEIPLKKVNHEQHYRAQISTAVEATGKNDDVHKGRQVTQWSMTAVIASQGGVAWTKVPIPMNGDFGGVIQKTVFIDLPKDSEDLFEDTCASPYKVENYTVTEHMLRKNRLNVEASMQYGGSGGLKSIRLCGTTTTTTEPPQVSCPADAFYDFNFAPRDVTQAATGRFLKPDDPKPTRELGFTGSGVFFVNFNPLSTPTATSGEVPRICEGAAIWTADTNQPGKDADLLACPQTQGTSCRALLIVRESDSQEGPPVQLDDCELGPTEIELELDPPQKVLGYEYWDNEDVDAADRGQRSFFQWQNVGSSSWSLATGSSAGASPRAAQFRVLTRSPRHWTVRARPSKTSQTEGTTASNPWRCSESVSASLA